MKPARRPGPCQMPGGSERDEAVASVQEMTGMTKVRAHTLLAQHEWSVEMAVSTFFEQGDEAAAEPAAVAAAPAAPPPQQAAKAQKLYV